jgi:hypothetical protein
MVGNSESSSSNAMIHQTERTCEVSQNKKLHLPREVMAGYINPNPGEACPFLRLPLEIRDSIYRMLLTTPYCTQIAPTGLSLNFRLCTAILVAIKLISVEATRVLWEDKDFITLKVSGVDLLLHDVPSLKLLAEENLVGSLLQAEIEVEGSRHPMEQEPVTLITTPEGATADYQCHLEASQQYQVPSWRLEGLLKLQSQRLARYVQRSNLVLEPWTKINGVKALGLAGDIGNPMRERL